MIKFLAAVGLCLVYCVASNATHYCSKTATVIQPGFTLEAVSKACGKPTRIEHRIEQQELEVTQWVYNQKVLKSYFGTKLTPPLTIEFLHAKVRRLEVDGK